MRVEETEWLNKTFFTNITFTLFYYVVICGSIIKNDIGGNDMYSIPKKGIMTLVAAACFALPLSIVQATNSDANESNGGFEIVYDTDGMVSARAALESGPKNGGYWIRGKKDSNVYSSYKHYEKMGYASVVNGEGDAVEDVYKPANEYSTAKVKWTLKGTNKAYYDFK